MAHRFNPALVRTVLNISFGKVKCNIIFYGNYTQNHCYHSSIEDLIGLILALQKYNNLEPQLELYLESPYVLSCIF